MSTSEVRHILVTDDTSKDQIEFSISAARSGKVEIRIAPAYEGMAYVEFDLERLVELRTAISRLITDGE